MHVVLIVSSENLFLQWFVSAVSTERRIAGQTGYTATVKQRLITVINVYKFTHLQDTMTERTSQCGLSITELPAHLALPSAILSAKV